METQTDLFGRDVVRTVVDGLETYTLPSGLQFKWPAGHGWARAMATINKVAPAGWTPPEVTEG